jgi:hypothetical protein
MNVVTHPVTPLTLTPIRDLKLADTVRLGSGPFMDAKVHQITADTVTLWRPYIMNQDFSYTGGVVLSIGLEIVTLAVADTRPVWLVERGGPLK